MTLVFCFGTMEKVGQKKSLMLFIYTPENYRLDTQNLWALEKVTGPF